MENVYLDQNSLSFSTYLLRMIPPGSDEHMAIGTGFMYEYGGEVFLITNGHNVTRVDHEKQSRLIKSAAFPTKIRSKARAIASDHPDHLVSQELAIDLYNDDEFIQPNWYIHPKYGYAVDVIAIPIENKENQVMLSPINGYKFDTDFSPWVGDDVFILGYPFNITGEAELPIWKRGTIATEPAIDLNGLPKMYVDTATRPGMSGSPVIMRRTGIHGLLGELTGKEIFGMIENFIGIYSGRIGADNDFQAQLGIIWKPSVIEEILAAKVLSDIEFQHI